MPSYMPLNTVLPSRKYEINNGLRNQNNNRHKNEQNRKTDRKALRPLYLFSISRLYNHSEYLKLLDFVSLGAFLALNDIEGYLVTLIDCDAGLQASYMHEIILTVVACYESKALYSIEKLYCSSYHFLFL